MTLQEFDLEFDILYNNINSGKAPGINALEKSIFLTQAQELVVQQLYESVGFENSESTMQSLATIVETETLSPYTDNGDKYMFNKPEKLMYIVHESAQISNGCSDITNVDVLPVKNDDFNKIRRNPFRGCSKLRVLRLIEGSDIIIVSDYDVYNYTLRYIRHPNNIVLEDAVRYSVEGYTEKAECELPDIIHRTILYKAVELARNIWKQ